MHFDDKTYCLYKNYIFSLPSTPNGANLVVKESAKKEKKIVVLVVKDT